MSNRAVSGRLAAMPVAQRAPSRSIQLHPSARRGKPSAAALGTRFGHYLSRPLLAAGPILFAVIVIAALYASWRLRGEGHLTPEAGPGYALGIAGSSMMLLLMLYPLRKRIRALSVLGRVPSWFRWHMILGITGPSLVLVHANWTLHSLNATVAMVSMLTVVASGVIGRYLYSKIHMGLFGRKTELRQILADASILKEALGHGLAQTDRMLDEMRRFEAWILMPRRGLVTQLGAFLMLGGRRARQRAGLMRLADAAIASEAKRHGWSWRSRRRRRKLVRQHLRLYFATITKAARFSVYERMFALWHVLHFPLFLLLIGAALIHVIAVHLY